MVVNKSAKMNSVKNVPVFFLVSVFLFTICMSTVCGMDTEAILPKHHVTLKPWIQSRELISATQVCPKKYRPNHYVKQHAQNNPYFSDPNYTFDIIPRGSTQKPPKRINRATKEKPDEKLYQDEMNAEVLYDQMQKENIEAIFHTLAYETDNRATNIYDSADAKANMEAVFGVSTSELEQNKKSNHLNTADKGSIDNSTLMDQIADIFGPPPTDFNNLISKRKIDGNNYEGSLQAAIYKSFGPEVLEPSDTNDDVYNRFPPPDYMETKSGIDHKSTTTQGRSPAQSTPESRQTSQNSLGLEYPDTSGTGHAASSSLKPQEVPIPLSASTAPSRNGASAQKANLMLLNCCFSSFSLMAALVTAVANL